MAAALSEVRRVELAEERWPAASAAFQEAWNEALRGSEGGGLFGRAARGWEVRIGKAGAGALRNEHRYLCLERVPLFLDKGDRDDGGEVDLWESSDTEDCDSVLEASTSSSRAADVHYFDFHVLYNAGYQVPEVFFHGRRGLDGRVLGLLQED